MATPPTIRIPSLQQRNPIVDDQGRMTPEFARRLQDAFNSIANALNQVRAIPAIQEGLAAIPGLIQDVQDATDLALAAADSASGAASANAREQALVNSYITPASVLSATPIIISVAAHTRYYADGTTAMVDGGTVEATASGDVDYVSYVDPERDGGTVTYVASLEQPPQTGDTHVVGAVTVPAAGTATGGRGPRKPGYVNPDD